MKYILLVFFIGGLLNASAQCDEYTGYDQKGNLAIAEQLKCYSNLTDTSVKAFLSAFLVKSEITKGVVLYGFIDRAVGQINNTVKVELVFQDNSTLTLNKYTPEANDIGMFDAVVTDKYNLLFLKTKSVSKIRITGYGIDPVTYYVRFSGIKFMLGMECLQGYL